MTHCISQCFTHIFFNAIRIALARMTTDLTLGGRHSASRARSAHNKCGLETTMRERQAYPDIEVTREMIEAGAEAVREHTEDSGAEYAAEAAYRVMVATRDGIPNVWDRQRGEHKPDGHHAGA